MGVGKQSGVTTAIEVTPGAEFNLNLTYHLNWGDLAIYQIDNDAPVIIITIFTSATGSCAINF